MNCMLEQNISEYFACSSNSERPLINDSSVVVFFYLFEYTKREAYLQ